MAYHFDMMVKPEFIKKELLKVADPEKAAFFPRFFKAGKGEYAEGDQFIGVTVPKQRKTAKAVYRDTTLKTIQILLNSKIHEHRLTALLILVYQFEKADEKQQEVIYNFYLKNTKKVNNWDLVDSSADHIMGRWLLERDRKVLYRLAKSKNLWEKRIAIIATFAFIKHEDYQDTLAIAKVLLYDDHDLIHKAVGWMLREVGNRDRKIEESFLQKYYNHMPRTMLRYAIEKFPETLRQKYLKGLV